MSEPSSLPVAFGDVLAAADRLRGVAVETPLLESDALNAMVGGRLLLKAEPLQRTGSFKFRGAYNAISVLRPPAVVAYSSGNHAQGVALAARLLGIPATIVMPDDAPRMKLEGTRALGAEVVTYDRWRESREAIGEAIAARTGAVLIRPYDDPLVIAGQGTLGLEMAEQAARRGAKLDAALVCSSGGGLVAGCAVALIHCLPGIAVYCVEPAGFDDHARSLAAGTRLANEPGAASFCDALLAPTPGEVTFPINRRLLQGGLVVTDAEVAEAIRLAFRHLKLVVEPGGAVALAAALSGKLDTQGRTIGVVLSGGNVDAALFARILAEAS
ncbi:threonine ammonia-lyase [Benzoatithermus flavus]|uniref:Threonine/serine dehydratase n=1 Tax=Benzoatithermus flavus TaxID=3108223 RepID=A0ABU8XW36_9PROT